MAMPIELGVVGLGTRWLGYRLALGASKKRFHVRAVCDAVPARAESEARALGCSAAGGVLELLDHDGLEGVLVLAPRWQGLWPALQAVKSGKPVLYAGALVGEDVAGLAGTPVQISLAPRLEAMVGRVRTLLDETLGAARFVRLAWTGSAAGNRSVLERSALVPLFHACGTLLTGSLDRVEVIEAGEAASVVLVFSESQAHLSCWERAGEGHTGWRLEVEADEGRAEATPGELRWTTAAGEQRLRPSTDLPEWNELRRFARVIRGGETPQPGVAEVIETLGWLREAQQQ